MTLVARKFSFGGGQERARGRDGWTNVRAANVISSVRELCRGRPTEARLDEGRYGLTRVDQILLGRADQGIEVPVANCWEGREVQVRD